VEHFRDTEDHLCIVTKLADGGDIQAQVKKAAKTRTYLPEETIWSWLIQLCCAIKHVHDRKILHRDIKTANIFLQSDGDSNQYLVKLGDFGIAKVLEHTKDNCKTAVGTPYYMSPELCQNKEYNNKSDVWAIGCVLYELCTLKNPFDAHNFNALCVKILRGKYESIPPQYSSELSQVVRMCLEQQAKRRPDINQLLSLPQMKHRIDAYSKLSKSVIIEEFSHTALHGYNANKEMLTPRGSRISSHAPPPRRPHPSASPRSRVTNTSAVVIEGRRNSRDPPRTAQELEEAIR
jgi:NIMA (never in mitosis gene a)-related kinase